MGGTRHAPADPPGTPVGTFKASRNAHGKHRRHDVQHPSGGGGRRGVLAGVSGSFPWAFRASFGVPCDPVSLGFRGFLTVPQTKGMWPHKTLTKTLFFITDGGLLRGAPYSKKKSGPRVVSCGSWAPLPDLRQTGRGAQDPQDRRHVVRTFLAGPDLRLRRVPRCPADLTGPSL